MAKDTRVRVDGRRERPLKGARLVVVAGAASLAGCSGPAWTTHVADLTASVFVLELSLPEGVSAAEAAAAESRALEREAAELALAVTEAKIRMGLVERTRGRWEAVPPTARYEVAGRPGAEAEAFWRPVLAKQRAALAALPAPEARPPSRLEVRERWRYVALSPAVAQLEEGGFHTETSHGPCGACMAAAGARGAVYLRSFGLAGADPAAFPDGALDAGVELPADVVLFGSAGERDPFRVARPATGRFMLRRVARCPARLVRVEQTLVVDSGSGVIAVPHREAQTWHELRDAACAGDGSTRHDVLGGPTPPPSGPVHNQAARFRIEQHRAELARLERGGLGQPLP